MDQLANHENICGRKKVDCPVCREEVSQLELEIHLEAFHSVETASIDWDRPLTSQVSMLTVHMSDQFLPYLTKFVLFSSHAVIPIAFVRAVI